MTGGGRSKATEPPVPESERMLRHTWTAYFSDRETLAGFERMGAALADYAREAGLWGADFVRTPLAAIADDLESLAACLEEVASAPTQTTVKPEELFLTVGAKGWAVTISGVVTGIRAGLDAG